MDNNGISNQKKESEVECPISNEEINISDSIKKNLKSSEAHQKLANNDDENNLNNDYEDSSSYSTLYRSSQNSFNKNSKDIELSLKRKLSSTISNQSDIYSHELNAIPKKQYFSQKAIKRIKPINLFGNDSNNLLTDYYKGTNDYFKNLYLNKNEYQKSKNFIKKEIFYQDYDDYNNDFSLDNQNNEINDGNTNNNSFISYKNNILNNKEEKKINEYNNNNINNNNDGQKNNIYNTNNNFYFNKIYINPNITFNNINRNNYDLSMCYLGYYSVDCKSFIKINLYYFLLLFSIFRNTYCSIYPKKIKE